MSLAEPHSEAPGEEIVRPKWQADAGCIGADPDIFFPYPEESSKPARDICAGCVVRQQCLIYAIETDQEKGIWGGLNRRQRNIFARAHGLLP